MADLPEFVYLIKADGEWPVSAIADDHPATPETIDREVQRRRQSANVGLYGRVRIWRVPVAGAVEMDLVPAQTVKPSLRVKLPGGSDG
jgi:hypothetical protein